MHGRLVARPWLSREMDHGALLFFYLVPLLPVESQSVCRPNPDPMMSPYAIGLGSDNATKVQSGSTKFKPQQ